MLEAGNTYSTEMLATFRTALVSAMEEVFTTMIGDRITVVDSGSVAGASNISSIIGFAGQVSGFLSLHFSAHAACKVAGGLLGMPLQEIDEMVRDAVAELANMVAGGMKKYLNQSEEMFKVSIPSVVEGLNYSTRGPASSMELWLGVQAPAYIFRAQVVIEAKKD